MADVPLVRQLIEQARPLDALRAARDECRRRGSDPALAYSIGLAAASAARPAEAEAWLQLAVAADPGHAGAHAALAFASKPLGRLDARARHYARAVELSPRDPGLRANRSEALLDMGEVAAAEREARAGLALAPGHVACTGTLARSLLAQGFAGRAVAVLQERLAKGDDLDLRWQLAHVSLAAGRFVEGFAAFEARRQPRRHGDKGYVAMPGLSHPEWQGDALAGRRLLVVCEQGLGDNLFAMRYVAQLARAGETVSVATPEPLVRLVTGQPYVRAVYGMRSPIPRAAYDCWCFALSLPRLLGEDGTRRSGAYLAAPHAEKTGGVGICWAGSELNPADVMRSIPVERFAELASVTGVRLVSCQFGAQDLPAFVSPPPRAITDVADLAATIGQLDLLISVDSAPAHLAGAMGCPVWLLTRWFGDWRWADGRETSHWYPAMRIFRQPRAGDWTSVFGDVRRALAARSA